MQDFTKDSRGSSLKGKATTPLLTRNNQKQQNWLKTRLNKDNAANLLFFGSMLLVNIFVDIIARLIPLLTIPGVLGALTIAPYLLSKFNPATERDGHLFASDGRALSNNLPKGFPWLIVPMFMATLFTIFFIHDNFSWLDAVISIYAFIFWSIPTLYFILRNCPISVVHTKTVWKPEICYMESSASSMRRSHSFSSSQSRRKSNPVSDPAFRSLSINIHNSHRR